MLNLSICNNDGSPEASHFSWVLLRRKMHKGDKGGVDGIYLTFDYISLSDFLFAHIVTRPPPLTHLK
jgi:hypothetical protein